MNDASKDAGGILMKAFDDAGIAGTSLIIDLDPPAFTDAGFERNLGGCSQNICGNFGKCWSCPPKVGAKGELAAKYAKFSRCAVIPVDVLGEPGEQAYADADSRLHKICAALYAAMRSAGISSMALAGGPCRECAKCSYPEPCRFPDRMIPSATGFGLQVLDYVEDLGIKTPDSPMRLYGFVLY